MKEFLYVLGLKKNLYAFIDGQVLMWPKGKNIEDAVIIGEEEGGLYKLKGHSETTLVHESTDPSELWHRRLADINYKALPHVNKVVTRLPDMKIKELLYVSGLNNNLIFISSLDKKGYRVAFIDGQVLMWPKGKNIEDVVIIGEEEGGLINSRDI